MLWINKFYIYEEGGESYKIMNTESHKRKVLDENVELKIRNNMQK